MSAIPQPWPDLAQRLRKIEEQLRRLSNRSAFFGTGIHTTAGGGMASDSFDGDLATDNAGTTGWAFNDQKVALGEVILRPRIIGNDALSDPVVPGVVNAQATNFALAGGGTAGLAEKVGANLTVPAGCTRLLANVQGSIYAVNPATTGGSNGAGGSAYYCAVQLDGSGWSDHSPFGVSGSGGFATASTTEAYSLTGLTPGDTLRLSVGGSTGYVSVPADSTNRATVSATLLWLR